METKVNWWDDGAHSLSRIKRDAIDLRIYKYGKVGSSCPCDFCQINPGIEYHHICSRGRTSQNAAAERLADDPAICAIVCKACHIAGAPTVFGRRRLLRRNVETYGLEAVKTALEAVNSVIDTYVRMPEDLR